MTKGDKPAYIMIEGRQGRRVTKGRRRQRETSLDVTERGKDGTRLEIMKELDPVKTETGGNRVELRKGVCLQSNLN